jgi:hypothetical protein
MFGFMKEKTKKENTGKIVLLGIDGVPLIEK